MTSLYLYLFQVKRVVPGRTNRPLCFDIIRTVEKTMPLIILLLLRLFFAKGIYVQSLCVAKTREETDTETDGRDL
jgi:hypothetical protein